MKTIKILLALVALLLAAAAAFVASGVYNVAADAPHWTPISKTLAWLRDRSIAVRASAIAVPPLDDDAAVRRGAGNYDAMCAGCHLAPETRETELHRGLYPTPPNWQALGEADPAEAFWTIKHGIKSTGMPAWGRSVDDGDIWAMVALMRRLPGMTGAQYDALVAASPGHRHGGGPSDQEGDARPEDDHDEHAH